MIWATLIGGAVLVPLAMAGAVKVKRRLWSDTHVPYSSLHIRFGPDATATKEKPKTGQRHP